MFSMEMGMIKNGMRPVHPGEVLREDFLKPLGMSAHALSKALHVPAGRVNDIVLERRGVSPDTALRLARFFGGDAQSWLNLQQMHDLKLAEAEMASRIEAEIEPTCRVARQRHRGCRRSYREDTALGDGPGSPAAENRGQGNQGQIPICSPAVVHAAVAAWLNKDANAH